MRDRAKEAESMRDHQNESLPGRNPRCMYHNSFSAFLHDPEMAVLGVLQDGFVNFVDEEDMTVEKIGTGYCWFKARQMRYRVVPD